jgi:hypothetical protein
MLARFPAHASAGALGDERLALLLLPTVRSVLIIGHVTHLSIGVAQTVCYSRILAEITATQPNHLSPGQAHYRNREHGD